MPPRGGLSQFAPTPTEGIKLIGALYRDPTLENLKRMMAAFVYDASSITDELYEQRLANSLAPRDHPENFIKSLQLNPKQFPDSGHRLPEIQSETPVIWGIPRAEMHILNQCGHWAQQEHADKFDRMVGECLKHDAARAAARTRRPRRRGPAPEAINLGEWREEPRPVGTAAAMHPRLFDDRIRHFRGSRNPPKFPSSAYWDAPAKANAGQTPLPCVIRQESPAFSAGMGTRVDMLIQAP